MLTYSNNNEYSDRFWTRVAGCLTSRPCTYAAGSVERGFAGDFGRIQDLREEAARYGFAVVVEGGVVYIRPGSTA